MERNLLDHFDFVLDFAASEKAVSVRGWARHRQFPQQSVLRFQEYNPRSNPPLTRRQYFHRSGHGGVQVSTEQNCLFYFTNNLCRVPFKIKGRTRSRIGSVAAGGGGGAGFSAA
jgi:hypothetical protein